MDSGLQNKAVLVSGGGRGIGAAVVTGFAAEGAQVAIVDRNADDATQLADRLNEAGGRAVPVVADLRDEQACRQAVDQTVQEFGQLDVLVNNAGVNDAANLDQPLERFVDSLRSNLFHVYCLTHFAVPHLKATRGNIVNVTSKVATTGQGGTSGYAASKGAINGLTREWAVELSSSGVRVNAVAPAEVMTPMYEQWLTTLEDAAQTRAAIEHMIPLERRFTTSDEIAHTVVFLASALASHTTGQILYPDGGYVHLDRAKTSPDLAS